MTTSEISLRLEIIDKCSADCERAHSEESQLWRDFIEHVQSSSADPELAAMAKLVLSSEEIEFNRWFA